MLFKWEWCDFLVLDTQKNADLQQVYVPFCTLINYFRKLFEFFRGYIRHVLAETTTGRCSLKKVDPKSLIKKGEEWQIDNEKNIEKLL